MRNELLDLNGSGATTIPKGLLDEFGLVDEDTRDIRSGSTMVEEWDADERTVTLRVDPDDE